MRRAVAVLLLIVLAAAPVRASETASATLSLLSSNGPTNNYGITLTDTGTTNIGTFWYAWVPGQDFLDSVPNTIVNPIGWTDNITGSGNASDGSAIQWVASSNAITPGNSLNFGFSSTDTLAQLAGFSNSHPSERVGTSFIYIAGPETDAGYEFVVNVPEPASLALVAIGGAGLLLRRPRWVS